MNNRIRGLAASALATHQLVSPDDSVRLRAALTLQNSAQADQLPFLSTRLAVEKMRAYIPRSPLRWRTCNLLIAAQNGVCRR